MYVGDSVAAQVVVPLHEVMGDVGEVLDLTFGGTALCDWFAKMQESASWEPHVVVIDHGGNALTDCMKDAQGEMLRQPARGEKYKADTETALAIAAEMGTRVLLLDQPAGRGNTASGTSAIFRAAAVDNEDGTVRFFSLWPAISPDGFKQSDSCLDSEPGCVDGHGELRSEPPGGHLETLGAWRYAVAIRAALEEAGWLG
jgi:hypothetical protein